MRGGAGGGGERPSRPALLPRGAVLAGWAGHRLQFRAVPLGRYCQWFAGAMREHKERHQRAVGRQPATAPKIIRKALFHRCSTALGEKVALGDPIFDRNLDQLRLDLFRNVERRQRPADLHLPKAAGDVAPPGHAAWQHHGGPLVSNRFLGSVLPTGPCGRAFCGRPTGWCPSGTPGRRQSTRTDRLLLPVRWAEAQATSTR